MEDKKNFLDYDGLLFYSQKLKEIINALPNNEALKTLKSQIDSELEKKVSTREGYDLSKNDFTDEYKQKVDEAGKRATLDGTELTGELTKEELDIATKTALDETNSSVSTNTENISTNTSAINDVKQRVTTIEGAGYQTSQQVTEAITSAIAGVTQIKYQVVKENLPESGENGVIYLKKVAEKEGGDIYQEYIWLADTQKFEALGYTNEIDLSIYIKKEDMTEITNQQIEQIVQQVFPSEAV